MQLAIHAETEKKIGQDSTEQYWYDDSYGAGSVNVWRGARGGRRRADGSANEEHEHAHEFQKYLNSRGGQVRLLELAPPEHEFAATDSKSDALLAFEKALELEKSVYQQLLLLHQTAGKQNDPNFEDKVEGYLEEQVESIKKIAEYVSQLTRLGTSGSAVYMFDNEFE